MYYYNLLFYISSYIKYLVLSGVYVRKLTYCLPIRRQKKKREKKEATSSNLPRPYPIYHVFTTLGQRLDFMRRSPDAQN